jgi:pimeloyl-ACP methyl ester carboxylesterase
MERRHTKSLVHATRTPRARTRAAGCLVGLGLCLTGCFGASPVQGDPSTAPGTPSVRDVSFEVAVRGSGSAAIHARVYENTHGPRSGANVLAVHGWTGTSYEWQPLAKALLDDRTLGQAIQRVIAIDQVGHGDSTIGLDLLAGSHFGSITVQDNASVLVQSIDALQKLGLAPSVVLAHDLGGLEVQAVQQALLDSGSSLAAHGVTSAVLLAPIPPQNHAWNTPLEDRSDAQLFPVLVSDPELGSYFAVPTPNGPGARSIAFPYTTRDGQRVAGAPSVTDALVNRYLASEPSVVTFQMVAALPGPMVSAGVLASRHGTLTSVMSFSEDIVVPAADAKGLYEYLTEDTHEKGYQTINAQDAVHNMLISNPTGILEALRKQVW